MGMNDDLPLVTLETLGHGAAAELFEKELERVLDNIMDPDTVAEAKRSITLKVEIVPTESRTEAQITITASSKIASARGAGGHVFIGLNQGRPVATSFNVEQQQLRWDEESRPRSVTEAPASTGEQRKAQ